MIGPSPDHLGDGAPELVGGEGKRRVRRLVTGVARPRAEREREKELGPSVRPLMCLHFISLGGNAPPFMFMLR